MEPSEDSPALVKHSRKWDRAGLLASGLCLIHCLIGPIIFLAYPTLSQFDGLDSAIHLILLPSVMIVALLSFVTSYRQHLNKGPILLGTIGIALLLISFYFGEVTQTINTTIPAIVGSLILIGSHLWNIQACRCFCAKSCSHTTHEHL